MWREVGWHLGGRIASGLLSFVLFAQIARILAPQDATPVFFFSFVFGFLIASLRTFHVLAANVQGHDTRATRLRRVLASNKGLLGPMLMTLPLSVGLFSAHGMPWQVVAAAAVVVLLSGMDADLVRAAVGKGPAMSLVMALGGMLALAALTLTPQPSAGTCAALFLLQWLPVLVLNFLIFRRCYLVQRRQRRRHQSDHGKTRLQGGTVVLAVFDGAVLNAPFIVSLSLSDTAGLDLAVGTRLFVASLPLFPLIAHWLASGHLHAMATGMRLSASVLFASMQLIGSLLAGTVYAVMFVLLSGKSVSVVAYLTFVGLLFSYVVHATSARFFAPRLSTVTRTAVYGGVLSIFYAALVTLPSNAASTSARVVVSQMAALAIAAVAAAVLARRNTNP